MQHDDRLLPAAGAAVLTAATAKRGRDEQGAAVTSTGHNNTASLRAGGLCSELASRRGLPLIGSAGSYDAILAFELAPPWTARLVGSRASDAALDAAMDFAGRHGRKVRVLALEPDAVRAGVRVLWLARDPGNPARFVRHEYEVPRGALAQTIERLAAGGDAGIEPVAGGEAGSARRDILVCTHGARDACCGKFGYPIYRELCRLAGNARSGSEPVKIWRTSHLGGHRFAPTLLDLPSGRMFGRLTIGDAEAVLGGGQPLVDRLAAIYRGHCGLPEAAQIVERDLWLASGSAFPAAALSWNVDAAGSDWHVEMCARSDLHGECTSIVRVTRCKSSAVSTPPSCGRDPEVESPWQIVERVA